MSLDTLARSVNDPALHLRIRAAIAKEAWGNPASGATQYGQQVRRNGPDLGPLLWAVCVDYEAEYAYAVDQGNDNPGGDASVITDANISAAVQTHWPQDPPA